MELTDKEKKDAIISSLRSLKRYKTSACAGYEGSGDTWTELDEEIDGDLVKWEDIENIINSF